MADRPRTADYAWTVLARVLSVAKDRGQSPTMLRARAGASMRPIGPTSFDRGPSKKFATVGSDELQFALCSALWTDSGRATDPADLDANTTAARSPERQARAKSAW